MTLRNHSFGRPQKSPLIVLTRFRHSAASSLAACSSSACRSAGFFEETQVALTVESVATSVSFGRGPAISAGPV